MSDSNVQTMTQTRAARRMLLRFLLMLPLCAWLAHSTAHAAEIIVPPGLDALAAAVTAAADGDTLILDDGAYGGDQVTIDKSLVIRAVNRLTEATVTSGINIKGAGIEVTIQGLRFTRLLNLNSAASVRILENTFTGADVNGRYYDGSGSLIIIGNTLVGGSIDYIVGDDVYIAGNVITNGYIWTEGSAWIVGNLLLGGKASALGHTAIVSRREGATARILGNRVRCNIPHGYQFAVSCIYSSSSVAYLSANIIELEDLRIKETGPGYHQNAIHSSGTGFSTIINNVIRYLTNDPTTSLHHVIEASTPGSVVNGNIIIDYPTSGNLISATSPAAEVTHNLCFNNNQSCPTGEGNLTADPKFVDLVDYRLKPTSPAIDVGPPDYPLADLDRTRNDIGAYGGPWSIGQFDAQRAPGNLAPYIYPIFKIDNAYGGGDLELQAIGVARLR